MRIGIVCGYGSNLDEQLKQYVSSIMEYAIKHKINSLIFSGGYTFKKSTISEARLMASLIVQPNSDTTILLEEKALTTLHNLIYSKKILESLNEKEYELFIFCDQVRFIKVNLLSKILFKDKNIKIIKVSRKELLAAYILQIPSIFYQGLGAIYPKFEKKILLSKQKWIDKYR